MLDFISRVHQYIIQKYKDEDVQVFVQQLIHHLHELSWGVGEPKWHHQVLIQAPPRLEGCLLHVLLSYWDLPISGSAINLAEHTGLPQTIKHLLWKWEWIPVLDRLFIQPPIIDTKSESSIFLRGE